MSDAVTILKSIQQDERYLSNLDWGTPRPGHPEGTIRKHIEELERNLGRLGYKLTHDEQDRLRLVIHTHDTFKPEAGRGVRIADPLSHASLACQFLEEFCDDDEVLMTVQWHDEPYALWRKWGRNETVADERLQSLVSRISDWNFFLAFQLIDGCTHGKTRVPLLWFLGRINSQFESRFSMNDVF